MKKGFFDKIHCEYIYNINTYKISMDFDHSLLMNLSYLS